MTIIEREVSKWESVYEAYGLPPEDSEKQSIYLELAEYARKILNEEHEATTLETGCGTGLHSLALARAGFKVDLLDFSTNALDIARALFQRACQDGRFHEGDVLAEDELTNYDLVFNSGVLEHYSFEEQVRFLQSMARRSRRFVLVLVPNRECYWYWIWRVRQQSLRNWPWGYEKPASDYTQVFSDAGLQLIETSYFGCEWTERNFIASLDLPADLRTTVKEIHKAGIADVRVRAYLVGFLGVKKEFATTLGSSNTEGVIYSAQIEDRTDRALAHAADALSLMIAEQTQHNTQVVNLTHSIAARERQIASLNQAVAERDSQLSNLTRAVAERDQKIDRLTSILERNRKLEQALAAAQAEQQDTKQELASLEAVHAQILNSRSWRLTRPLRWSARILRGQQSLNAEIYEFFKVVYRHLPVPLRYKPNAFRRKCTEVEHLLVAGKSANAQKQIAELSHPPLIRHIAMLVPEFIAGGLERVVLDLSRGLRDRGHKISILSAGSVGKMGDEARTLGLEVAELKGSVQELERLIGSLHIDLLFTHHCYLGLDTLAHRGIPVVEVLHNAYFWQRDDLSLRALRAVAVQNYVAVSSFVRNFAVSQLEIPADRVAVINNGIGPSGFIRPGPQFLLKLRRRNAAHFTFVHAANFHSTKCHNTLVSAFSRVARENPLARLFMVGEPLIPELATSVAKRVDSLGLSDRIYMPGPLNRRELSNAMSTSHAALLPSSVEGFSIASLEYLYFGLPVITTDTGSARDIFDDQDAGVVIPGPIPDFRHLSLASVEQAAWAEDAGHASALSEAMLQFISDRQQWLDKIDIVEARAAEFSVERTVDQYNQCLLRVM